MVLHYVQGADGLDADDGADVEADAGFFEMSPASAEQVTIQIRSMMERAWEYIAIAYQGRAHIALGYASWDQYVDDRLGRRGHRAPCAGCECARGSRWCRGTSADSGS